MRLTRITKIREHRVFRDFAWPRDLHAFGQFNLIYGWNGSGKTTLSSLLSLVEKRAALTEGEIELEFDNNSKVTGAELAGKHLPNVRVFNREFVNTTLQSAGGIAPIYFLGEESIEKQTQVDQLKRDLASANTEVVAAVTHKTDAESKLDTFCIVKARRIYPVRAQSEPPGNTGDRERPRRPRPRREAAMQSRGSANEISRAPPNFYGGKFEIVAQVALWHRLTASGPIRGRPKKARNRRSSGAVCLGL